MIIGVGIDLVEIERIEEILVNKSIPFMKKILTENEITYVPNGTRRMEYLAGRFAAKEAVAKALGTGFGAELSFQDIEILNNERGKPYVKMNKNRGDFSRYLYHISISHTKKLAIAKVIIEQ